MLLILVGEDDVMSFYQLSANGQLDSLFKKGFAATAGMRCIGVALNSVMIKSLSTYKTRTWL